jgi:predicted transcriptional regulator
MNKMTDTIKAAFGSYFPDLQFPRVRAKDPITSFEAADSIKEIAAEHQLKIIQALQEHGPMGKDGIAAKTSLDGNQVARRMRELEVQGYIKLTGFKVKSNTGRNEREWAVVDKR